MGRRIRMSGNLIVMAAKDYDRMCAELERLREMERSLAVCKAPVARPFVDYEKAKTELI